MSLISPPAPKTRTTGSAAPPTRLDSLTGMRWCAALLIFCFHFSYEESASGTARHMSKLKDLTFAGPSAVSFFFVLSGFVLAWSARPGDKATGFWRRRFARIYPSHAVTFCVAVVLLIWMGQRLDPSIAVGNLTLTQAWVPDRRDWWFGYNGVSWSLSCEFFFYFTFPFVISLVRRFSKRLLWATVVLGNLFVVGAPAFMHIVKHATGWSPNFYLYMLPAVRLAEFVIGIALALLVKRGAWRGPGMVVSVALSCVAVFGLARVVPFGFHWNAATIVPYTLTIAAAARADAKGEPSPFRNRWIVYLGEVSFAFYLVHEMAIFASDHFLKTHHFVLPLSLHAGLVFSVALLGAVLLHEYVEKPGVKLLSRRKRSAAVTG